MKTEQKPTNKYQGMTRKQWKRKKALTCSEKGTSKNQLCQATGFDKALAKYPRAIKNFPNEYFEFNLKRDLLADRKGTFFINNR